MLEDTFADIIGKARFGLRISFSELFKRSGLPEKRIRGLEEGELPAREEIDALASGLSLDAGKLADVAFGLWEPRPVLQGADYQGDRGESGHPIIRRIDGRIGSYPVNGYLFLDCAQGEGVLFDTGYSPIQVVRMVEEEAIRLTALCITHAHPDHVGGAERIRAATRSVIYLHPNELSPDHQWPEGMIPLKEKEMISVGRFQIRTLRTPGHTPGGTTYLIEMPGSSEQTMAFVGDALFAGSLGRAQSPSTYATLLNSVRTKILSLRKETLLFPGHGPVTTVEEEQKHNPFFVGSFPVTPDHV